MKLVVFMSHLAVHSCAPVKSAYCSRCCAALGRGYAHNSVCQTRTVTNLYAASLLLAAKYAKDETLWKSVFAAAANNEAFQKKYRSVLEEIAVRGWENAVVLADGPVCGIAEEGALAFTEIAMLTGRYFPPARLPARSHRH